MTAVIRVAEDRLERVEQDQKLHQMLVDRRAWSVE